MLQFLCARDREIYFITANVTDREIAGVSTNCARESSAERSGEKESEKWMEIETMTEIKMMSVDATDRFDENYHCSTTEITKSTHGHKIKTNRNANAIVMMGGETPPIIIMIANWKRKKHPTDNCARELSHHIFAKLKRDGWAVAVRMRKLMVISLCARSLR